MPDPIKNDLRQSRREAEPWDTCARCLNAFPWRRLQSHHLFGRRSVDQQTALLCEGCHEAITRMQRDLGVTFYPADDLLRVVADLLLGMAATLEIFLRWRDLLVTCAERLQELARYLDTSFTSWSKTPEGCW